MIADELAHLAVPIERYHFFPNNPRRGDVQAIARSLERFGQRKPIVARPDGTVIAGNHTLAAASSLGWDEIAVVHVDDDMTTAAAYALADNRTAELGGYDEQELADLITSVGDVDQTLLAATGWDDDSIEELLKRIETAVDIELEEEGDPYSVFDRETLEEVAFHHYRKAGFPFRKLARIECLQQINALAATPTSKLVHSNLGYHVADTFHPHRLAAHAVGMASPLESFASDKQLRRALKLCLDHHGVITDGYVFSMLCLVAGTQAARNFRPGFALRIYRQFTKAGDCVLDTSTGYGGRLVGFLASECSRYVGIDPSTETDAGNRQLVYELGEHKTVDLVNLPAEDVEPALFADTCDFAFTSPPYFSKEHYADEDTQSFKRYPQPDAWRRGFLEPMMELQYVSLRPGSYAAVNIADVDVQGVSVPLERWTNEAAAKAGFELVETMRFPMPRHFATQESREAYEPVFVYRKDER